MCARAHLSSVTMETGFYRSTVGCCHHRRRGSVSANSALMVMVRSRLAEKSITMMVRNRAVADADAARAAAAATAAGNKLCRESIDCVTVFEGRRPDG